MRWAWIALIVVQLCVLALGIYWIIDVCHNNVRFC